MQKSYKRHPNRLVDQYEQDIDTKCLYAKIRTAKSTVDRTNKVFQQKLEERKRRELKTRFQFWSSKILVRRSHASRAWAWACSRPRS